MQSYAGIVQLCCRNGTAPEDGTDQTPLRPFATHLSLGETEELIVAWIWGSTCGVTPTAIWWSRHALQFYWRKVPNRGLHPPPKPLLSWHGGEPR